MSKISYSGVVLTSEARTSLLSKVAWKIPDEWEIVAHHMTVNMGELPVELKQNIGLPVVLKVISFHMNEKVAAVQVLPPPELVPFVKNKYPHITVAVNRQNGGKPVMSNDLLASNDRKTLEEFSSFELMGVLEEIPQK